MLHPKTRVQCFHWTTLSNMYPKSSAYTGSLGWSPLRCLCLLQGPSLNISKGIKPIPSPSLHPKNSSILGSTYASTCWRFSFLMETESLWFSPLVDEILRQVALDKGWAIHGIPKVWFRAWWPWAIWTATWCVTSMSTKQIPTFLIAFSCGQGQGRLRMHKDCGCMPVEYWVPI